jgi:hypothetical protein
MVEFRHWSGSAFRRLAWASLLLVGGVAQVVGQTTAPDLRTSETGEEKAARMAWWREARFGLLRCAAALVLSTLFPLSALFAADSIHEQALTWNIENDAQWQDAAKTSENLAFKDGMARPTAKTATKTGVRLMRANTRGIPLWRAMR